MAGEYEEMREIIDDFIAKTDTLLDRLDKDLKALGRSPDDPELLNSLSRTVRTIRSAAGFLGFEKIADVSQSLEDFLNRYRKGGMKITPRINDALLEAILAIRRILDNLRKGGEEAVDVSAIVRELQQCFVEKPFDETGSKVFLMPPSLIAEDFADEPEKDTEAAPPPEEPEDAAGQDVPPEEEPVSSDERAAQSDDPERVIAGLREILAERNILSGEEFDDILQNRLNISPPEPAESDDDMDSDRFGEVIELMGELVLGRNRMVKLALELEQSYDDDERVQNLVKIVSRLDEVTSELQQSVLKARSRPFRNIFRHLSHVALNTAKNLGKEVEIHIEGEDTELDKSIIGKMKECLAHMVHNAVTHGIELPEERVSQGKPRAGKIQLSARHDGNRIIISIGDDGSGLDTGKIFERAVAEKTVEPGQSSRLSESEKLDLIFSPSFASSRGERERTGAYAGMDEVKNTVGGLNGDIRVESKAGRGTLFTITLPVAADIIRTIVVQAGRKSYALPIAAVSKTMRVRTDGIQHIDGREFINIDNELLPLARFEDIFNEKAGTGAEKSADESRLYALVVGDGERKACVLVDRLMGWEEVVIKSLGNYSHAKGIAGATVLGNGNVSLVVDIAGLMEIIDEMMLSGRKSAEKTGDW